VAHEFTRYENGRLDHESEAGVLERRSVTVAHEEVDQALNGKVSVKVGRFSAKG
jgi:hypothetical protein